VNSDGIISFDEFSEWWRRDQVTYTIKRSEPQPAMSKSLSLGLRGSMDSGAVAVRKSGNLGTIDEGKKAGASDGIVSKIDCPVTVFRGDKTRYEVIGLEPNRLYHFKLRLMGSRCNSHLSIPAAVMTAPRAPPQPILLDVSSTTVRVKWYPPLGGAYKFAVQLRNLRARVAAAGQDPSPGGASGWITVFNGQETVWQSTTMVSESQYEVRILGVNYQGSMGQPSPVLAFTTLPRTKGASASLTKKDADAAFTIECSGDICVGDTLLITEQLFVKDSAKNAALEQASRSSVSRGKGGAVRMDMSVTSLPAEGSGLLPPGAYIGDRTIAAIVVKDNYRTGRDSIASKGLVPSNHKKFGRHRSLWLEVLWQRSSTDACKPFELKAGEVVERTQAVLEEYEVYRVPWRDEAKRMRLDNEWPSLVDCFRQSDCEPLPAGAGAAAQP
jgi:hypothetical protein